MITLAIPRRLTVALLSAAFACLLLPAAGEAKIVEGKSVARVKLGMTKKKVKRILGKDYEVNRITGGSWDYERPNMRVGFRNGKVNVLLLWDRKQKTRKKIGMGSTVEEVQNAYPNADCVLDPNESPYIPVCFLSSRFRGKQTETYFRFDKPDGKVVEVSVHFGSMRG
jgi:hypothetical protein